MVTRLMSFALVATFGLIDLTADMASAQTPAQKKAMQEAARKRAQRLRQQQQRDRGPALDEGALDTTPTFESVTPKDAAFLASLIASAIQRRLAEEGVPSSPICDDATFIRRVYIDLTGTIPPPGKVAAFITSQDAEKRAKLIDELLASPEYGKHLADTWTSLMVERFTDNRRISFDSLTNWLADGFNENKPWDRMVHEILTAEGDQEKNGAVTYYLANLTPDKMTDSACRVFMGVQLQCAQCHDHPFTDWKQDEYWEMAAFFMKVQPQRNNNKALKGGATPGIQELKTRPNRIRNLPEAAKFLPAKFLQGERPEMDKTEPFRPVLADWMTTAENPYFAKAMVNRTWAKFFGRGFVNPVDDMIPENLPSHPELLNDLAKEFGKDFDLKQLTRGICNSQTYQRCSKPVEGNEDDEEFFSRMSLKVMSPEQLFDSMTAVIGEPANNGRPQRGGRPGAGPRDRFVEFYLGGGEFTPTNYEAGIPQALRLMNSNFTAQTQQSVRRFLRPTDSPASAVQTLYLATVSRPPSREELQQMVSYVSKENDKANAYGDILWALLNSSEFVLNR